MLLSKNKNTNTNTKITVPFNELTEFELIKLLQLILKVNTFYTILFQYTSYEQGIHIMLGPQTGIPMRETPELNKYRLLFEHYLDKLEILMDRYNIEQPPLHMSIGQMDFIVIYLKELILEESIKNVDPISQIAISKGLVRVVKTKQFFSSNILPPLPLSIGPLADEHRAPCRCLCPFFIRPASLAFEHRANVQRSLGQMEGATGPLHLSIGQMK